MGDMWDEYKADCYWQPLPPRNVDEARSGEHKSIFVNVDHMADKMTWTVEKGELSEFVGGPFDRLDDAKACADEALEMAYAEYPVEIVKDEGLGPRRMGLRRPGRPSPLPEQGGPRRLDPASLEGLARLCRRRAKRNGSPFGRRRRRGLGRDPVPFALN